MPRVNGNTVNIGMGISIVSMVAPGGSLVQSLTLGSDASSSVRGALAFPGRPLWVIAPSLADPWPPGTREPPSGARPPDMEYACVRWCIPPSNALPAKLEDLPRGRGLLPEPRLKRAGVGPWHQHG